MASQDPWEDRGHPGRRTGEICLAVDRDRTRHGLPTTRRREMPGMCTALVPGHPDDQQTLRYLSPTAVLSAPCSSDRQTPLCHPRDGYMDDVVGGHFYGLLRLLLRHCGSLVSNGITQISAFDPIAPPRSGAWICFPQGTPHFSQLLAVKIALAGSNQSRN